MFEPKYVGGFSNRNDVAGNFREGSGLYWDEDFTPAETFPTEDQILYANYDNEDYEGNAFVLFERDGKLYEVNGSHCSCYGLEDQWRPEETTWEAIAIREASRWGVPSEVVEEAKHRTSGPTQQELPLDNAETV